MHNEQSDLEAQLKDIEKWEKEQQKVWFWERIGRIPFKVLDKLTPAFIQDKIGLLLDEIGGFIQNGGRYLTSEKHLIRKFQKELPDESIQTIDDIKKAPISVMDHICEELGKNRANTAVVQGATTGVGGLFTLAIDIPAILGLSLKTLQDIAVSYGYDPKDKTERMFIIKCLQLSAADIVGKKAIIGELSQYHKQPGARQNMISQIQGWREVVYTYRDSFGWKKLFQMVPVAGILFGAVTNRSMISGVAEAGMMMYKKRRILERLEDMKNDPETSDPADER
ncbi:MULTISPECIES: EcsC family protein [Bacillus]|uniref:EcsC family protein n=1 Tax=Bacillus TaxID=1386 RepID=UPI001583A8AA|nr:EcsC family protein [Bacillus glycinifermentans]MBU8788210.1 EcsC family protein [Bacillus glycinifermentans]NUJ18382.1 EcsC family protein [Bacillus glycinifermentans]